MVKKLFKYLFENTYEVGYLVSPGSWTINEEIYTCKAYSKRHALRKFYKDTINDSNHYSDRSVRQSYRIMKDSIKRIKN